MKLNNESLTTNLDRICELRDKVRKVCAAKRYNTKVKPRSFRPGDLVWRLHSDSRTYEGKFSANWEGLFRVHVVVGK